MLSISERIERIKKMQKHELPILEYDSGSEEVIKPNHGAEQLKLPEKCVYAFLGEAVDAYAFEANAAFVPEPDSLRERARVRFLFTGSPTARVRRTVNGSK